MKSNNSREQVIKFFRTGEHDCSYLPDQQSRTLFLDPELKYSLNLYEELTHSGFRRSGKHLYRPDCQNCHSCIPARIPVADFQMKRRFRRVTNLNKDVSIELQRCTYRDADYELFERYITQRHSDGDMYPPSKDSYGDFLAVDNEFSFQVRYSVAGRTIGIAVTDHLKTGLSAIYTFFEPEQDQRSLGVFSILKQIELCQQLELPYLYLGYWIPGCKKMNYKTAYQPVELLIDGRWHQIEIE
ncbi:arginyltransferase [Reinekea marinisedimentorum]|uniref:Aspartate/glutamate leucyltransferase n=1 Tax=Reinekea marinisedimentorum TaxID=230495 RepID=A0A4R3I8A0_9GAMM|nr:arginyltransferase [Reinekea marinisedimentorum]TCS42483.1 arginine-tRNA-protein transferase [Reinekea marinisedimentorum]